MNITINFIIEHKEEIEVILALISAFSAFCVTLFKIFKFVKKRFSSKPSESSKEAIYLSEPHQLYEKYFEDKKRNKLQKKVIKEITDGKKKSNFTRKSIFISGEEGIGKSLFGYKLFEYNLQQYPIYFGWIKCNGKKSIFEIIEDTFTDPRFCRKSRSKILSAFNNLEKSCILFVDEINQYTPLDELEELSHCSKVILLLFGTIRKIDFADYTHILSPLSDDTICKIFEHYAKEEIDKMDHRSRESVTSLLENYVGGNPFLAIAFASVKHRYEDDWENVLKSMKTIEYEEEDYLKNILRRLYKINKLSNGQKSALSKLSTIQYTGFTDSVFELLDISGSCVKSLCNLYWLEQKDSVLYSMDKVQCNVIAKLFMVKIDLKIAINSINKHISKGKVIKNNKFKWISLYIEGILEKVQGFAIHIMEESFFFEFAYNVAENYRYIKNYKKCIEWIELCKSEDTELAYKKTCTEFQAKYSLVNILYSPSEIEKVYFDAVEKAKVTDDFENNREFLLQEYCNFLIFNNQYNEAKLLCKEYFESNGIDLSKKHNCDIFYRYLCVANKLEDEETLRWLINETNIVALYQNDKISITAAWSFGKIGSIYRKWGDKEKSDKYMRHMVVLLNQRSFFSKYIKDFLQISDMDFAEYMHSSNELLDSLNDAVNRKDVEALYIEGRYQEKYGNYDDAFALYEEAATRDSLRGMCSLALLYYKGQGTSRNYEKARKYWEYCCERGHRGSYYWLGILLLDTDYSGYDKESALKQLTKAAELGSERAKQKLLEC